MNEGWVMLTNSRRAHYFRDSRSLCGAWAYFGHEFDEDTGTGSSDDCRKCGKVLDRERSTWHKEAE